MRRIGRHAVVLGAGMGGLLAARVLSDAFDRVTVIERDPLTSMAEPRRGVPQGRHSHLLIPSGAQVLDELFPRLFDDLSADGVPVIRDFSQFRFAPGGEHPVALRGPAGDPFICQAGRPRLEWEVRSRLVKLSNVETRDECTVLEPLADHSRGRVTGVRVKRPNGIEEDVESDLVVDATGRGSRAPLWLEALGYDRPVEEQLTINLRYVTQQLRLQPDALDAKVVGVGAHPGRPAGFILFTPEDGRWMLTVFGYEGHHPPVDRDALLAFVRAAAPADVFAAIRDAEPLGENVAYRFTSNLRRRYDKLRRFPAGLVVVGDAICCTNPAHALGMSSAALQAAALWDTLAGGGHDLARRFFSAAAEPVNRTWQATVGSDLALPQVKGPRPLPARIIGAYAARAMRAAERDPVVAERLLRVASLQDPPTRLFRPATALRILT